MDTHKYDSIIGLKHHQSPNHPRMPIADRAAQFSPFAALTGYDDVIRETSRLTEKRIVLDESQRLEMDRILAELLSEEIHPVVELTYFVPDLRKEGGSYQTVCSKVKRLDDNERSLVLEGGDMIRLDDIVSLKEC